MATLDRLLHSLSEADSQTYAATGEFPLRLTATQHVQFDGACEVQALAVERTPQRQTGRVIRALCWDGTREHGCWHIRCIRSKAEAAFCGIIDHGYTS